MSQALPYSSVPAPRNDSAARKLLRTIPLLALLGGLAAIWLSGNGAQLNAVRLVLIIALGLFTLILPFSAKRALRYARFAVLGLIATVIVLPFVWLICSSFKKVVFDEYSFLPPPGPNFTQNVNTYNFKKLFAPTETVEGSVTFWRYIFNSLFLASAATIISLIFCSMGGYAMAKFRFRGRTPIITFMLASMTIPGVVLLAPNFSIIWHLGWMDTYRALIVPGCVSVFGIFLYRQAMLGVPDELIEAGRIDGCSEWRIYLQLIMPLVRPMTGAFCLISFLGNWNSFLGPNIFLQSQSKLTLPVVLNQYLGVYQQEYGV